MQSDEMRAWVECSLEFHGLEEGFARLLKKHASAQQILHSCGIKDRHETAERILAVCKKLGISRATLWRKLKELKIEMDGGED